MDAALDKIRPHAKSTQAHQKAPAELLLAIEQTLAAQRAERSPTAYFAALLTTLESTLHNNQHSLEDGDILPAQLYLLALLSPFVPAPVLQSNLSTLLTLTAPLFPILAANSAPALRSQLTIYHAIFSAIDRSQLDMQGIPQSFASILNLCLDHRPKVRKRAQEVVRDILASPPPPLGRHPYSARVADWLIQHLSPTSFPHKSSADSSPIHLLALLRPIMINLPPSQLPKISSLLLSLPRLGDIYVSQSAYSILADLFSLSEDATTDLQPTDILEAVLASPPNKANHALAPSWSIVLGEALVATCRGVTPDGIGSYLLQAHAFLSPFFESPDAPTRRATAAAYANLCRCFSPKLVLEAYREGNEPPHPRNIINKLVALLLRSLDSVVYAQVNALPDVLTVASALFQSLGRFQITSSSKTILAPEAILLPFLRHLGSLRVEKTFIHKESADQVLASAIRVLGPAVVLRQDVLPLNLIPESSSDTTARAFLLPLLANAQHHPSPLQHFVDYFIPLSEQIFEKQQTAESSGKANETKIWSVLMSQIWSSLGGYVRSQPGDLSKSLSKTFAQMLSNLLYSQVDLRPDILKALRLLVQCTVSSAQPETTEDSPMPTAAAHQADTTVSEILSLGTAEIAQAQANLEFLKSQAESWLAIFFNLYGSLANAGRDSATRTLTGEAITVWASICSEKDIATAYGNVLGLCKGNLPSSSSSSTTKKDNASNSSDFTQLVLSLDLLILLLSCLTPGQVGQIMGLVLSSKILACKDTAVVKRGYRLLGKIVETRGKEEVDALHMLTVLCEIGDDNVGAGSGGAKKDRLHLIRVLVPLLPSDAMHMIPRLLTEAVLGTKEPAEKARTEAFDLVVAMGEKMRLGGVVKRRLLEIDSDDKMEDGDVGQGDEASASIEEYLTMMAAGLAGGTPHMVSASITAISRVVFEFKEILQNDILTSMLTTILVFVQSNNREIVKSALGFVKLAVHSFPLQVVQVELENVVRALLRWSGDRKNHFKLKVRHIFERMLRRFAWETVFECVEDPNGEQAKVLLNIKKRKDRAKRKKAKAREDGEDGEEDGEEGLSGSRNGANKNKNASSGDAFEDVLYGSESELEDSDEDDDDEVDTRKNKTKGSSSRKKNNPSNGSGARLHLDNDDPMDLLQGANSKISHSTHRRKAAGQDAARFKNDESGRMIVTEGPSDDDVQDGGGGDREGGNAYKESLMSEDGFTRGADGRVKFNKNTQKRRREAEEAGGDVDMEDGTTTNSPSPGKRHKNKGAASAHFGSEFKAKRAGGDVKKGNVDPYAYVSLSQAAGKKQRGKLGISGKRK